MKTVSIREAAEQFASLAELALQGESVLIEADSGVLILREYFAAEPLPLRASNGIYSDEEIQQDNLFAKRPVIPLDSES